MTKGICVMGVGNVLMGDDALGPWVIHSLETAFRFPPGVTLLDVGASGLDLTLYLEDLDALIVVDALQVDAPPGTVLSYRKDRLVAGSVPVVMSPHEPSLREALMRLVVMGGCPRSVLLVGAVPRSVQTGPGLSGCVRRAVPLIEAQVLLELARLGVRPEPLPYPPPPAPWWERKVSCASASLAG